MFGATADLY